MAWVRKNKNGYVACYKDRNGLNKTVKGQTFTHKRAAQIAANEAEERAQRRRTSSDMTWGEWRELWQTQRTVENSTQAEDKKRIDRYLSPRWDDVRLDDIERADLKEWRTELLAPYETKVKGKTVTRQRSTGTVNRVMSLMSKSLSDAVDSEVMDVNPARGLTISGGDVEHERFLTKAEVAKVAAELSPRWALLMNFLAYTGLRWGEAKIHSLDGIYRKRIDVKRGVVQVFEVWDDKAGEVKPYPKGKTRRTVPVPRWIIDQMPTRGPRLLSPRGAMPQNNNFRRALNDAADRAEVPRFRVHDLRHTYASWLVQSGVPLERVQLLLGHKTIVMTQRYAHLGELPHDEILSALA